MSIVTPHPRVLAAAALLCGGAFVAKPAEAWWRGGFFFGFPPVVVAPAPVYPYPYPYPYAYPYPYPPPYYPPAYYPQAPYPYTPAQPQPQAQSQRQGSTQDSAMAQSQTARPAAIGTMCYAGVYHCVAPADTPVGATCSCPAIGAPSYGSVQ